MAVLSSKSVGTTIKIKVNGSFKDFIIVHQGIPNSSHYDSSCNGTWLLMKDIYTKLAFHSSDTTYDLSNIKTYLNGTFLNLLDTYTKGIIKQVKIPYIGSNYSVKSGSNGLSTKVFLLSAVELGHTSSTLDGKLLSYFSTSNTTKRVAKQSSTATPYWTRTAKSSSSITGAYSVTATGTFSTGNAVSSTSVGVRPALILPSTTFINSSNQVVESSAPTTPGTPSFPTEIKVGDAISVAWTASSDADSDLSGYQLYVSVNGGDYSRVYTGSSTSYTYTVQDGTDTISFMVRAYDSADNYSDYATSETVTVLKENGLSGFATIGSVSKQFTGEGYVCVGGVLKPIAEAYICVGGVWKHNNG